MKTTNVLALAALALTIASPAFANQGPGRPHCGHKGGHMFERVDANKDGVISKAEFRAQGDRMFAKLDLNRDGRITKAESDAAKARMKAKWHKKRLENRGPRGQVEDTQIFYNR